MSKKLSLRLMMILLCAMSGLSQAQVKPKDSTSDSPVAADSKLVLTEQKPLVRCLPGVADFSAKLRTPAEPNLPDPITSTSAGDTYGQGKTCFSGYYEVEATNTTGLGVRLGARMSFDGHPRPTNPNDCLKAELEIQIWGYNNGWKLLSRSFGPGMQWALVGGKNECTIQPRAGVIQNSPYTKLRVIVKGKHGSLSRKVTGFIGRYVVVN